MTLALAGLLLIGACDEEEEKPKELIVRVPEGTVVRIEQEKKEEMIVVGELVLFLGLVAWALFGPGAGRRFSENR